jgi:hypothetical protein
MSNYILALVRESDIKHDPWGTAMSWQFAVCENLAAMGGEAADSAYALGFTPGAAPCIESYEDVEVMDYLTDLQCADPDERLREVQYAGRILERYIDWCKAAGRDY